MIYARIEFEVLDTAQRAKIIAIASYVVNSGAHKRGVAIKNTFKSGMVNRPLNYYERLARQLEEGGYWPESMHMPNSIYFFHEEDIIHAMLAWDAEQLILI